MAESLGFSYSATNKHVLIYELQEYDRTERFSPEIQTKLSHAHPIVQFGLFAATMA